MVEPTDFTGPVQPLISTNSPTHTKMAERSEDDFNTLYSSIDDTQYESYVEMSNTPSPYIAPCTPLNMHSPVQKPKGLKPLYKPRHEIKPAETRSLNRIPSKPQPFSRAPVQSFLSAIQDEPLYEEACYPPKNVQKSMKQSRRRKPNTPVPPEPTPAEPAPTEPAPAEPAPVIQGKLMTGSESFWSDNGTRVSVLMPSGSMNSNQYSPLSSGPSTNEYESLKPQRIKTFHKLKEKVKSKKHKRLGKHDHKMKAVGKDVAEDDHVSEKGQFSDGSRTVCLLLSIMIVSLVIAIGSLTATVYTVISFEHYRGGVSLQTTLIDTCNKTVHISTTVMTTNCSYNQMSTKNRTLTDTHFLLGCKVKLSVPISNLVDTIATLVEEVQSSLTLCLCQARFKTLPVPPGSYMSCIMTKTVFS